MRSLFELSPHNGDSNFLKIYILILCTFYSHFHMRSLFELSPHDAEGVVLQQQTGNEGAGRDAGDVVKQVKAFLRRRALLSLGNVVEDLLHVLVEILLA